jgi:flagellar biosynthetic protein FlhB
MAEGAEDRTEAATPARLIKAKATGNVAVSRELPIFAGLLAAVFALASSAGPQATILAEAMEKLLEDAGNPMPKDMAIHFFWSIIICGLHIVLPIAAASAAAIAAANLMQTGFVPKLSALHIDVMRVSPKAGFLRLLSRENAVTALKSIVKVSLAGGVMFWLIMSRKGQISGVIEEAPAEIAETMSHAALSIVAALLAIQGVIAAADFAWTRVQFAQSMRMSHTEVKDESKDSDGNPHVKARLKQIFASRSKQNLQQAMARAAVVITNPTHYAVALEYRQGQTDAPKIIAKGAGDLAARIRALAKTEGVPLISNPPLARALFKLDLDIEIPPEHYQAVAEVIAYVWRLSNRKSQNPFKL